MDYVYQYLAGPILIGYFLYMLAIYLFALNTWKRAKGNINGYVYRNRSTYLLIGFRTEKGEKIEFEERGYALVSVKSFYKLHYEVDVLYSPSSPDVAIIQSIISPTVYIACIAFFTGLYFCF